jgi:hypothetical protein
MTKFAIDSYMPIHAGVSPQLGDSQRHPVIHAETTNQRSPNRDQRSEVRRRLAFSGSSIRDGLGGGSLGMSVASSAGCVKIRPGEKVQRQWRSHQLAPELMGAGSGRPYSAKQRRGYEPRAACGMAVAEHPAQPPGSIRFGAL